MHRLRPWSTGIFGLLFSLVTAERGGSVPVRWHHGPSPYRAVFDVVAPPSMPEAGYFLSVPICGIGDGRNVSVFDAGGQKLFVAAFGSTLDNCALVLAGGRRVKGPLFAYWGSRFQAPQAPGSFTPGLTVDIRTAVPNGRIDSWEQASRMLTRSRRLGILPIPTIELADNPVDASDAFIMVFNGFFSLPRAADWQLFLVSENAGYLFIDDKLTIQRNGRRRAYDARQGEGRQRVRWRKGVTPVRVVVIDTGGGQMGVLARYEDAKHKYVVPAAAFVRSGRTKLRAVEAAGAVPCASFSVTQMSYCGTPGMTFTEVRLASRTDVALAWKLGNGIGGHGRELRCLLPGTATVTVKAVAGGGGVTSQASGVIQFSGVPPRRSWQDAGTYAGYVRLISAVPLAPLAPDVLSAYYDFLMLTERHAAVAPMCRELLRRGGLRPARRREIRLALARTSPDVESARASYRLLLTEETGDRFERVALEYLEFELYRRRDPAAVRRVLPQIARRLGANHPNLIQDRVEAALLAGDKVAAATGIGKLRDRIGPIQRQAAVLAAAAEELANRELGRGAFSLAEEQLRRWAVLAPGTLTSGQYALMRARLLQDYGWLEGALAVLDAVIAFSDLPPFLPQLEFRKAVVLDRLGRGDEACELWRHIVRDYPRHPLVPQAQQRLRHAP